MVRQDGETASLTGVMAARGALVSWVGLFSVLSCVLGLGLAAQVRIPVPGTDVPMTLQSLAVLLCGFRLAPRVAATGMLAYLALGATGVPVFAPGSGGLAGGTGGYIVGFVVGAWLVSTLKGGERASIVRLVGAGLAGTIAIFACGLLWRAVGVVLFGGDVLSAVVTGFVPFAVESVVQSGVAVSLVVSVRGLPWNRDGRRTG